MAIAKPCYPLEANNPNEIWKSDNTQVKYVPTLALQIAINIFASNIFYYILKRLHQPRLVAEALVSTYLLSINKEIT